MLTVPQMLIRRGMNDSGGRYAFKDNQIDFTVTPGWQYGGYNIPSWAGGNLGFGNVPKSAVYMKVTQSCSENPSGIFNGSKLKENYQEAECWPNIVYTANILLNNGFSLNAVAAIIANITCESGFNPGCYAWPVASEKSLTFGLFQWYHYHDIVNYIPYPKNSPYWKGGSLAHKDEVTSEWEFANTSCRDGQCTIKVLKSDYQDANKARPHLGGTYKKSTEMKKYYREAALWPGWDLYDIEVQLGMFCCFDVETSYMKYDFSNRKNWKGSKSIYNGWQNNLRDYYWVHGKQCHLPNITVDEFKISSQSAGYLAIQFMASYLRPAGGAGNDKGSRYDRAETLYKLFSSSVSSFEPRLTEPVVDKNKNPIDYYYYVTADTFPPDLDYLSGNCVGYVRTRAHEIISKYSGIQGKKVNLGNGITINDVPIDSAALNGDGSEVFNRNKDRYDNSNGKNGYPYGQEPQLGAVGCMGDGKNGCGHVYIVEEIAKDGSYITISDASYHARRRFGINKLYKKDNWSWSGYPHQGFIYLPIGSMGTSATSEDGNVRVGWSKNEDGTYTLPATGKNARTIQMGIPSPEKVSMVKVKADIEIAKLENLVNATDVSIPNSKDACLYTFYTGTVGMTGDSSLPFPTSGVVDENSEKAGYPQGISLAQKIPLGHGLIGSSPGVRKNITFNIPIRGSQFFGRVSIDKETQQRVEVGYWGLTTVTEYGNYIINVDIKEVKFC